MKMKCDDCKEMIFAVAYRYLGKKPGVIDSLRLRMNCPGYIHSHYRIKAKYYSSKGSLSTIPFLYYWFRLWRCSRKYGIYIPYKTKIGNGLYIGHWGGIFINSDVIMGNNCNISQGVAIGVANRGKHKGCPIIGNNVYIAPGAKIFGSITIGNNVAIGANAVVTKDIPDDAVAVGVPARVISFNGSKDYINNTEYYK